MKKRLLSFMFLIAGFGAFAQTPVVYVKPDGSGDGSSWANACSIAHALGKNAMLSISAGTEIWVQQGTYHPEGMLTVPESTFLYGGFLGTETSASQRDFSANPTIIDAQKKYGSVVRLQKSSVIDGFTIRNGYANDNSHKNGGGIWGEKGSKINHCSLVDNYAVSQGGGIYAVDDLEISDTKFSGNLCGETGSDVYGCCIVLNSSDVSPVFCTHPSISNEQRFQDAAFGFSPLTVSVVGSGPLTYQWFSNTANSTSGGTAVGTNSPSHTPSCATAGSLYYFVVVSNAHGRDTSRVSGLRKVVNEMTFDYTGAPVEVMLPAGDYQIECWGAQGGDQRSNSTSGNRAAITGIGSRGGYSAGVLSIASSRTIYVYVGQLGGTGGTRSPYSDGGVAGWNGGAAGGNDRDNDVGGGGGGATDIRLVNGAWNNTLSLRSRFIVAGGGGGSHPNGVGGGVNGGANNGLGLSTQTAGYTFGAGQTGGSQTATGWGGNGGGGGGWYGGRADGGKGSGHSHVGGNGGSGFVSGHPGCNAVNVDGTHRGDPNHYSNLVFSETVMTAGNANMPNPRGTDTIVGNPGHGFVRITKKK